MTSSNTYEPSRISPPPGPEPPVAVVAFGGNALLQAGEEGDAAEQRRNAARMVRALAHLWRCGYAVVAVHGNGPQVGHEMMRHEAAATVLPALPLDFLVASTQGTMGHLLEVALRNEALRQGYHVRLATVLTAVEVDPADPAFRTPTKPVGPFMPRFRARQLASEGRAVVEDAGRGWRLVVPSPRPLALLNAEAIATLARAGFTVICGGGGGIPLVQTRRKLWRGVEAVVDKDRTAALVARVVGARLLVVLTAVPAIYRDFGTPRQRPVRRITARELGALLEAGAFPPGSMAPKVESVVQFVQQARARAIVTSADRLGEALDGRDGTTVVAGDEPLDDDAGGQLSLPLE